MTDGYKNFDDDLRQIYRSVELKHLNESLEDGTITDIPSDVLRAKLPIIPLPYSDFKVLNEMDFITQDIKYITGTLYLLRPYINNPLLEKNTYRQTVGDRRYLMHFNFGLQAIYNFWDRIGDLLWHYFQTGLKEREVYFSRIIELIPTTYKMSEPYLALLAMYHSDLKTIIEARKNAVHYLQPECRHYWGHIENYSNPSKIDEMFKEKFGYADLMKKHLEFCLIGFSLTLKLINELPEKLAHS